LLRNGHSVTNSEAFGVASIDDLGITIKSSALLTLAHGHWTMLARLQRLGPWLFCLFLVAQIGGVTPLVYVDVVHEYAHHDATEVAAASQSNQAQSPQHQHNPGTHDEHDQCCALHHGLVGMLPQNVEQARPVAVRPIVELAPTTLASVSRSRLDRPPRA
jgi:hypothetical protein